MKNLKTYANTLIDELCLLKDKHKHELTRSEVETINNAANLIEHNIENLTEE
jgi:hypothetical protein